MVYLFIRKVYSNKYLIYCSFTKLINEFHPKKYLSLDEFLHIRREIVKPTTEGHSLEDEGVTEADDVAPPGMEDLPPGEDAPPPPSPEVSVNGAKKGAAAVKEDDKTVSLFMHQICIKILINKTKQCYI